MTGTSSQAWAGDLLHRSNHAKFLEKFILDRFQLRKERRSLCITVDGDWGAGKTFFVNNWQQSLSVNKHPVAYFDAWSNDLSDEPLIGFISALEEQIKPWLSKVPTTTKARNEAKKKWGLVVKNAGRAVLPVGKALADGLLKKFSGSSFEDFQEAINSGEISDEQIEELAEAGQNAASVFIKEIMKVHESRKQAIRDLKNSLEELLKYLESSASAKLPMFVFIDELDRCRPDYAIRLLEGVKHIFDVEGICFVASTNLTQLAEATKAVYGNGFDANRYLKRFFDFDYRLPRPNYELYAAGLLADSTINSRKIHSALFDGNATVHQHFALVAQSFHLDLRSQRQLLLYAEAAASSIPIEHGIYCLPLFFFAALLQQNREIFEKFEMAWENGQMIGPESLESVRFTNSLIHYRERSVNDYRSFTERTTNTLNVLSQYFQTAPHSLSKISARKLDNKNSDAYPGKIVNPLLQEIKPGRDSNERSSLWHYPALIRMAGNLS